MSVIEIKRKDNVLRIENELILAQSQYNNKAFRLICKELGAGAICSAPILKKKNIDFEGENIIATLVSNKFLKDMEKNESIKAYLIDIKLGCFDEIVKKTTKPIIVSIDKLEKVTKLKQASAILIKCLANGKEVDLNYKLADEVSLKFEVPILSRSKVETPEEIHGLLKKTKSSGIVLGDIAFRQPVIFEQTTNYFEKGYYNKITRKRREKTVEMFEGLYSEVEEQSSDELYEFKDRFMNE